MAEAARAEDLDKSEAFQQTLSSFKQELAGKYLFDEQSVARNADVAFDTSKAYQVFTLSGRYCGTKTDGLQPGIYLLRQGKAVKKIVVK